MPAKHAILTALTTDELRANGDEYEIEGSDRRVKGRLVDALVGSRTVRVDEMLQALSRDLVKEL